ncbi:MAG: hypothetical protein RBR07_01250 [Arcobacteraceae bacterium]|nr:hypothetical protein [Arcobacteraceae bacterium]
MNFSGLSLDQAPPIFVPFGFFITASILGIFGSFHIAFFDYSYVYFHFITIGFFGFVMIGALFQMFPVMIGIGVKKVLPTFYIVFFSLLLGLICFYLGYTLDNHIFMALASLFLISGFLSFCLVFLYSLFSSSTHHDATSIAMAISLIFLTLGTLFGAYILAQYYIIQNSTFIIQHSLHINTLFFGTIFILIMGISFKIIPMFWVAKDYPIYCKKFILPLITFLVSGFILLQLFGINFDENIYYALFALPLLAFYSITIRRLKNRKRRLTDYSIYFLYTGLSLGFIGALLLIAKNFITIDSHIFLTLFGFGCVLSYIFGLLYKIVPFLCWFHLTSKGLFDIPTIKEFIELKYIKAHFITHILFIAVSFFSIQLASFLLIVSFALLLYNISKAYLIYQGITKKLL